jgi:hypothetical protein
MIYLLCPESYANDRPLSQHKIHIGTNVFDTVIEIEEALKRSV